ncbi:TPA: hypothetical protein N0H14_004567 [Pseudomonas aeruginosa]|nr:hypothetical protein [Pseudomonas aeruginosa]HCK4590441.1 hypothetical protein [Pseudomonas aeruginosa]
MDAAVQNFNLSLSNISNVCNKINSEAFQALADAGLRANHETQQCGAVVLLTGYFEVFLKEVVKGYMEQVSLAEIPYASLPANILKYHHERGGAAIAKVAKAIRTGKGNPFGSSSLNDMVHRLNSAGTIKYQIMWEAFADTEANPGPGVVESIGNNLGVTDFWRKLSAESSNPAQWSPTALKQQLKDLLDKRNECAHTGRVFPVPTAAEILDYVDLLSEISSSLRKTLRNQLIELTEPVAV